MKKIYQTNSHKWKRLILSLLFALPLLGIMQAQAQTITIDAEPPGPLYVGDTIEVEYSATGFSEDAVFYLEYGGDSILTQSTDTTNVTLKATVPAGYTSPADIRVFGATGDPDGMVETIPLFGELDLAGTSDSYSYDAVNYVIDFDEPNIRRMQLPGINMVADSAYLRMYHNYLIDPDSLELVIEYSTNGGNSFNPLDTIEFTFTGWIIDYYGIPAIARTENTILRVRQMYSEEINSSGAHEFSIYYPSVFVGEPLNEEGSQALAGSPFALTLPSTNVTSVYGPADAPYNTNVYSGDSVYIDATITGFTDPINYQVVFNTSANIANPVYKLTDYTMEHLSGDDYLISGVLPKEVPFGNTYDFWVVPYEGASYQHGVNNSYSFALSGAGNHTINGDETIDPTHGIYFTAENVREVITPEYIVSETGIMTVEMSRREDVFSPENVDIIVEYSTDGSTYTEIGSASLNAMNVYTDGTTTFEFDILPEVVSNQTTFRIRQNDINAENLDRFYIHSYDIILNSNRLVEGLDANYESNFGSQTINAPVIDLKTIVTPEGLFYPGTDIDLDYEVTMGALPENSTINATLNAGNGLILNSSNNLTSGNISSTIPAVGGGTYTVELNCNTLYGNAISNDRQITIEEVSLEILEVTGNPAREVDGTPYYFSGDELIVDYNLIGQATNGVQLQIKDVDDNWITIGNDDPADENVTGVIPQDVEFPTPQVIRLALSDELYSNSTTYIYSRSPRASDFLENPNDSMFVSTSGDVDYDIYGNFYITFAEEGTRYIETKGFDISHGGILYSDVYLLDEFYSFEQKVNKVAPITLQYSIDNGATWVEIESVDHSDYPVFTWGNNEYISEFNNITLPIEAQSPNTKFRYIQNGNNALNFGENAWLFYYFGISSYSKTQIYSNSESINLQRASISLGSLPKQDYAPGESVTIPYNVAGNFGADVGFVTILEDDATGEEYIVDYNDATGQVQLSTSMPVNLFETIDNTNYFNLYVKPYQKTASVDYPVLDYMEALDDEAEDMIALEGGDYNTSNDWYYMYDEGKRSVLTKALQQVEGDSAYLDFNVYFYDTPYPTEAVFVEVTYDGGSTYTTLDTITEDDNYTIALATADLTTETHVRWVQYENSGSSKEHWRLRYIEYKGSNSNIISTSYYVEVNQPDSIEIEYPDHPADFTSSIQEDVIYSGETFTLELGIKESAPKFSNQAEYIFYLGDGSGNVIVDYTNGQDLELGRMTGLGSIDLTIPSTIYKGNNYEILTTIQIDDPDSDEPFVYYLENRLMLLDIYNPTLKTTATTQEVYRGEEATINWELQTGSLNTANYYFQLWLDNDNDDEVDEDEIIYTQKDAPATITTTIPTDANTGTRDIEVLVTTDSIYQEGQQTILDDINTTEWRDIQNGFVNTTGIYFHSSGTSNKAISQDFDMSRGGLVEFEVNYPENTSKDFLPSDKLIFEYSEDGGATYVQLDEFPNEDYELGDGWELQRYHFAKDELGDTVRFRIRRQSPNYGSAYYIDEFTVTENSNEAPVNTIKDQISILAQTIELSTLPENICRGNSFNLDYEIFGIFGEQVYHRIQYQRDGGSWTYLDNENILNVTEGTGTFVINMPENLTGGDYRFRIYSYDPEIPSSTNSNPTEDAIYLIPQIDFTGTTLSSDVDLCTPDLVIFEISNTQDGFAYRARNVATGAWVGDEVISDGSTISMTTETITENTKLEIVVTALSKDGELTCATGVLEDRIEFTVIPQRTLFTYDGFVWIPVEEGYSICEGTSIALRTGYYDKDGNVIISDPTSVGWYRDDMTTAVSSNTLLSTFNQSGTYFAQVTDRACKYLTDSVVIEVLEKAEKPTIAASGETTFCGGEVVTLTANEDYPYYRWYGGNDGTDIMSGSSQSIDVGSDGIYRVVASNYPIEQSCLSPKSDPIKVDVIETPNTSIYYYSGGTELDEDNYVSCGEAVRLEVISPTPTYSWMVDGVAMTSNYNSSSIIASQTGYYKVMTTQEENGVTCINTTDSIYVNVTEGVERPTLTLDGDAEFCAGEGSATLVAPEGYAGYWWAGDNSMPDYEVEANTQEVTESGDYYVAVVDENGCISEYSKSIQVTVVPKPDNFGYFETTVDELCGEQEAVIRLEGIDSDRAYVYQLIDMTTGLPSGEPAMLTTGTGGSFVELVSDPISEDTEFGVLVSDPDFNGCETMLQATETILVYTAEIEVIGNRLYAYDNGFGIAYQWYRNDEPIMGDRGTNSWIEIMDDADYKVEINFGTSCTLMSTTVSGKGTTGINDPLSDNNIQLYPNPVKDQMSLEMTNIYTGELTIKVVNIAGQVIIENIVDKTSQYLKSEINMQDLTNGVYFIHIISDDNKVVKSIIKQ